MQVPGSIQAGHGSPMLVQGLLLFVSPHCALTCELLHVLFTCTRCRAPCEICSSVVFLVCKGNYPKSVRHNHILVGVVAVLLFVDIQL